MKIFYSWQNDRLASTTKNFIEKAFSKAIKELNRTYSFSDRKTGVLELDRDTRGVPGYPDVLLEIIKKIRKADGYLVDLTFSAIKGKNKGIPNPNVMLELGYAFTSLGEDRVITVMNTYYGGPDILPFDLATRRWPLQYHLAPKASADDKKREEGKLKNQFTNAMSLILSLPEKDSLNPIRVDDSIENIWNHIKISNLDDWSEIYEQKAGLQQVYYFKNPNLRIVLDMTDDGIVESNFISPWANCFLHREAQMYKTRIFYNSTFINELYLISVDGGSALIPQPMEDSTGSKFRIPFLSYKIALLFDSQKNLDDYIDKADHYLSPQGMSLSIWPSQS